MASYISVGDTVQVNVIFRHSTSQGSVFVDPPHGVSVNIYKNSFLNEPEIEALAISVGEVGEYYYNWSPTEAGVFVVEFVGHFALNDEDNHYIREEFSVEVESSSEDTLIEDQELIFSTAVEPLLVDPEEFIRLYDDASRVEIMELIHRYSSEVMMIFKNKELNLTAYDYVRAAVMCALSRTYDYLAGDASSLTLGDLNISNQSYPRNTITRANAANWCELAAALRQELIRGEANIKAVVKGARYPDPMPKRKIKSPYHGNGRRTL